MVMTNAELEARVAELEAKLHDPMRLLAHLVAQELAQADPSLVRATAKSATVEPVRGPDLDGARARADEDLRQMRLRRRRGA
jgi:hypothetical protein